MEIVMIILACLVGAGVGAFAVNAIKKQKEKKLRTNAEQEAQRIIERAKNNAAKVEKDTKNRQKEFESRARRNLESEIQKNRSNIKREEEKVKETEQRLQKQLRDAEEKAKAKEREFAANEEKQKVVEQRLTELEQQNLAKLKDLEKKLENAANYSADEAKRELVKQLEDEARHEAARRITIIEDEAKELAENKAKRIISLAVSRFAGEYTAEKVVTVIPLNSDEMKGKIIGREGRNIRALEAACGVDLIIDETPEAVVISGFDPVRRQIARMSLETLMEDGRVHPARIEEVVDKVKSQLFKTILDDGDKACFELGIVGVDKEIIKLVGSLRYRTSFSQNNYNHCIEVGHIAGMMAAEMGVDVNAARRAGLLHDIGKALDHSIEGSHAVIGADFAKKHGESEIICHAIRAHHEDEKPNSVIAHLVQAADAISSARPGARKSTMDTYIRRLSDLESIGNSFDGVLRTFALQAGRELRVLVESSKVTDEQSVMLSHDIARKIEREMNFPGQIKVTVIRETRAVEHAR